MDAERHAQALVNGYYRHAWKHPQHYTASNLLPFKGQRLPDLSTPRSTADPWVSDRFYLAPEPQLARLQARTEKMLEHPIPQGGPSAASREQRERSVFAARLSESLEENVMGLAIPSAR